MQLCKVDLQQNMNPVSGNITFALHASALPVEIDPVVHPAIGLGGAAYCVVHRKSKLALLSIVILHCIGPCCTDPQN